MSILFLQIFSVLSSLLIGIWIPFRLLGNFPSTTLNICFDLLVPIVSGINVYFHLKEMKHLRNHGKSKISLGFILDVINSIPASLVLDVFFQSHITVLLVLALFTARHVRKIKAFLDHFGHLEPLTYRLVPIFVVMPVLLHLIACGWIALGSGTSGPDPDKVFEYVKAVYWSFTTLTTVGYGDISAKTLPQMIFTCGIQVIGIGMFGFILSNVASLLARKDAAREHHVDNLDKVENFMRSHHIPNMTRAKVRSYYHYMWRTKQGYRDSSVMDELPKKIQSELFFHINKPVLDRVPFLKCASHDLVEDLMNELEERVCIPGERIFKIGDHGDAMFFIYKGAVDVIIANDTVVASLDEGSFFGEMALLSDGKRMATVRAKDFCDLYVLSKESFGKVSAKYPEFLSHMKEVMAQRAA